MTITMSTPATLALVGLAGLAGLTSVHPGGPDDGTDDIAVVTTTTEPNGGDLAVAAAAPCSPLDPDLLDIDVEASGVLTFVYPTDDELDVVISGEEPTTCDEAMVVTSYASVGPEVDNHHDPVVDQAVFQAADLEAAGAAGISVELELDECWAGLEAHRDGDTLIWDDVLGDGCEMEITSDFAGTHFPTEIHVVQQTGNIEPPYMFGHDGDETTVVTGLPNGTWYVEIYDGAHFATTMAVDGGTPELVTIVHGVADGSLVEIAHPDPRRRAIGDLGLAVRR